MRFISKLLIVLAYCMQIYAGNSYAAEAAWSVENAISMARAIPQNAREPGYIEYYLDDPEADVVRAQYRTSAGKNIASKRLKYADGATVPTFEILDYRASSGYRVIPHDGKLLVHTLRLLERNMQAVVEVREVAVVEPLVVDAGFHRFLLANWDQVDSGEKVQFNFLQVDLARLVPLVIRRAACVRQQHFCVRVSLNNIFLRVFLPSVELTYHAKTRRLLHYSGIGPLPTASGDALPVDLAYQYLQ